MSLPTKLALAAAGAAGCFNNTKPCRLIFHSELHQELKGDAEHLNNIIEAKMPNRLQRAVNDEMTSSPPSDGIFKSFTMAELQGILLKVLPPALLALPEVLLAKHLASVMCIVNPCMLFCGNSRQRR